MKPENKKRKESLRSKVKRSKNHSLTVAYKRKYPITSVEFDDIRNALKNYGELARSIAMRYQNQGLDIDDLLVFAKIGLVKAAHRYDQSENIDFRNYAIWWVRQAIMKALKEQARIQQVPEILIKNLSELSLTFQKIEFQSSIEKRYDDIGKILDVNIDELLSKVGPRKS